MAPNSSHVDEDPVVATYSIYLTPPPQPTISRPRYMLIQYPDRKARQPYDSSTNQTPLSLRLKPNTGLVELDIPIDTEQHYNRSRGNTYATALQRSRVLSAGGSHGLAGGFNANPGSRIYRTDEDGDVDIRTVPRHSTGLGGGSSEDEQEMKTQTLGGKIAKAVDGDPIYMLGAFRGSELHLTHLDSLVQVRPQLHHLDAVDEIARGTPRPAKKGDPTNDSVKPETRAVEIKVKSSDEKNADRTRKKTNAEMLTEIQSEPWQTYAWLGSDDDRSNLSATSHLFLDLSTNSDSVLTSSFSPSSYLDAISAPRLHHSSTSTSHNTGLMSKIRGRERERRRRKNATRKSTGTTGTGTTKTATAKAAALREKLEETIQKTEAAVRRGDMTPEDAEQVVRSVSIEVEDHDRAEAGDDSDETISSGSGSGSDTIEEDDASVHDDDDDNGDDEEDEEVVEVQKPETRRRQQQRVQVAADPATATAAAADPQGTKPRTGRRRKSDAHSKDNHAAVVIDD